MKAVPKKIIGLVKNHRVIFSGKARHELDMGNFDTDDLIHSIVRGKVAKKERDERKEKD